MQSEQNSKQILIVDDEPQVLELWKTVLERNGYPVVGTTSGRKAIEIGTQSPISLLITDLGMPEPDGFEILKALQSQVPDLKVVVVSGNFAGPVLKIAEYCGAAAILQKPLAPATLLKVVRELLGH